MDAGISYYQNQSATGVKASQWSLSNSGYNSSRLGFRGTEDLGGGLAASFWLEAGLANDVGGAGDSKPNNPVAGQLFNRRSTVSLSGGFGEIRLGRDYTPTFWNDTIFDPFGTNGVGTNAISAAVNSAKFDDALGGNSANYTRVNNGIGYFLPSNLGGFYGQVMYGGAENVNYDPGTSTPQGPTGGRYAGGRFGYANGPLDVAIAYGQNVVAKNYQAGGQAEVDTGNFGVSYDFGPAKLFGEYSQVDLKSDVPLYKKDLTYRGYLVGTSIPVGPGLIRLAYSHADIDDNAVTDNPTSDKFALGYVHNLSKRTALYATAAYTKNKNMNGDLSLNNGGPAPFTVRKSYGYDFGVRHSF